MSMHGLPMFHVMGQLFVTAAVRCSSLFATLFVLIFASFQIASGASAALLKPTGRFEILSAPKFIAATRAADVDIVLSVPSVIEVRCSSF